MQLLKRILTAVLLIPVVLALVLRAPVAVLAMVAALVALLAIQELLRLSEAYKVRPFQWPTYIFVGLFFLFLAVNPGHESPLLSTAVFAGTVAFAAALAPFVFLVIGMRQDEIDPAPQLEFDVVVYLHRPVATHGVFSRHPLPVARAGDLRAEMARQIAGVQPARDPPVRNGFAGRLANLLENCPAFVRGNLNALVDCVGRGKSRE